MPFQEDVSVSVKLIITPEEVMERFQVKAEEERRIRSKDQWIITVYRDAYTHINFPMREKSQKLYEPEENTAFDLIIKKGYECFVHNNLQELGQSYENQNTSWHRFYNATIVVPIRYCGLDGKTCVNYGFLAADSLNEGKLEIYDKDVCFHILAHAADVLATFFLALELADSQQSRVIQPPSDKADSVA
jgi:hypothetical protein